MSACFAVLHAWCGVQHGKHLPSALLLCGALGARTDRADPARGALEGAWGAAAGAYLLAGFLLAFGIFASSLTDNVLLAALLAILFDYLLLQSAQMLASNLGPLAQEYYVRELLDKLDVMRNFSEWFARGLIDTSQVAFYVGGIVFFLCLTGISLAARRIA
jgi:ABC-2 type transport system permease protein